jgi:hypothetical protein
MARNYSQQIYVCSRGFLRVVVIYAFYSLGARVSSQSHLLENVTVERLNGVASRVLYGCDAWTVTCEEIGF